ncbi:hypothetical protein DFR52_101143 [Hoeflea marina]|uniref:Uncharacterized protein n=1 Tax=Hoeflea marina TaxID=274592 RepID=A0A317PPS0_9HYPH|nr:hypothetical protein [Hoeflea marina]PWW03462.1 hypothetical protein DFR52_101143 [Hoeflea marina]
MTKLVLAFGLTLAASTAAFAGSTALDAYDFPAASGSHSAPLVVAVSTEVRQPRLGDGSPVFTGARLFDGIDYTSTASIGGFDSRNRLGVSPRAE